ncbi:DUF1797 family protein [Pradoshia sp. D12]|jgi:uncharacterized protein YkuJ|uniref:YkuJ family protein n=1 Tax=Bacillaceae TaxID=186817 RepID=UPI00080ACCBA|nr:MULTISPECIES: YkuJ family protein [Bacillaceae]OCA89778.1 hypothetical protein A8L44_02230 [Bacillus sp. FJAT-27986]QFK70826.1 DUF1797 family protein [Pradoshia sp. D12]TPF72617.1 DUF1797 family protein [Bacillus sp. D12]
MSRLQGILSRLKNLQEQGKVSDTAQRVFEVEGQVKCQVSYFDKTETFELEIFQDKGKTMKYQFDNIDMIAIEIFELIYS